MRIGMNRGVNSAPIHKVCWRQRVNEVPAHRRISI